MGGNAGTQTMTVTVRALATRDLDIYNAGRIIRREVVVGLHQWHRLRTILSARRGPWFRNPDLGFVIAAAMIINMLAAALGGILIPLLLDRLGPIRRFRHRSSSTMITDVVGFLAFLSLATWWLHLGAGAG